MDPAINLVNEEIGRPSSRADEARDSPASSSSPRKSIDDDNETGALKSAVDKKDEERGSSTVERGVWGNQVEFIMTCVSYAGTRSRKTRVHRSVKLILR